MEVKTIKLPKYDWTVTIFYDYICRYMEDVLEELEYIGCGDDTLKRAYKNLNMCSYNNGLTFSNHLEHKSVVVIGRTDSAKEFEKTWSHESGHLADHICTTYDISPHGEEIQYLGDYIIDKTWDSAKKYLCDCCRTKKVKR